MQAASQRTSWWQLALLAMAAPWGVRASSAPTVVKPIANLTITPGTPIHLPDLDQTFSDLEGKTLHFEFEDLPSFINASCQPMKYEKYIRAFDGTYPYFYLQGDLVYYAGNGFAAIDIKTGYWTGFQEHLEPHAWSIAGVAGQYTLVNNEGGEVRAVQLSTPSNYAGRGVASSRATIQGSTLFTYTDSTVNAYSLASPSQPSLVRSRAVSSSPFSNLCSVCMGASDDQAVALSTRSSWVVLDMSTGRETHPSGASEAMALAFQDNVVYSAARSGRLELFQIDRSGSNGWSAQALGSSQTLGSSLGFVTLSGRYAFVTAPSVNQVAMIDLANLTSPTTREVKQLSKTPNLLSVWGQKMVVTQRPDGFAVYNLNQLNVSGTASFSDIGSHKITLVADNGKYRTPYSFWIDVQDPTTGTTGSTGSTGTTGTTGSITPAVTPLQPSSTLGSSTPIQIALVAISLVGLSFCSLVGYLIVGLRRRGRYHGVASTGALTTSSSSSASSTSSASTPPYAMAAAPWPAAAGGGRNSAPDAISRSRENVTREDVENWGKKPLIEPTPT